MSRAAGRPQRTAERSPANAPARHTPTRETQRPAVQDVLDLQRSAGNVTVTQLLTGQATHAPWPVQRAGGEQAQAEGGGKLDLTGSVGRRGDNQPGDVRAVQARLEELGFIRATDRPAEAPPASSTADAKVADSNLPLTIRAIQAFQKERAHQRSDGRIDPGGKTHAALRADQPALEAGVERVAASITGVFEGGRPDTLNTYDKGIVSYGKHQATLASGTLYPILKRFCDTSTSDASQKLAAYLDRVARKDGSLQHDEAFHQLLKDVAYEPAMLAAQEHGFREQYWKPSQQRADKLKITTALGRAFFYDSQIHGGLQYDIDGAKGKLGGVPGETVGGAEITEQQFVLAMIEHKGERLQRVAARQLAEATELEQRAAALEAQATTLQGAGDTSGATKARREAAGLRSKAKREAANGRALQTSATKSRVPAWRALAEAGDWELAGGAGGFLTVKGTPVVGTGGTASGTVPRTTAAEATGSRSTAGQTPQPAGGSTAAPPLGALIAALAASAGATVAALLAAADQLGMGNLLSQADIEEDLTDLVFALRHSELKGRKIRKDETGLAREWVSIRDDIIRPLLGPVNPGRSGAQDGAANKSTAVERPADVTSRPAEPSKPKVADEKTKAQIEAAKRLARSGDDAVKVKMEADLKKSGTDFDAWFGGIDPAATFLDVPIVSASGPGVHAKLVERLQIAEQILLGLDQHKGMTKSAVAKKLGIYSISGMRRPKLATSNETDPAKRKEGKISMHCYGLAVDINYKGNPFIRARSYGAIKRATRLVLHQEINVGAKPDGRDDTDMWTLFSKASDALQQYFRLADDPDALAKRIAAIGDGRSVEDWRKTIRADYASLNRKGDFVGRDPAAGFMDLSLELVEAMKGAGLLWGGMYQSGKDLMHFDYRGKDGITRAR